MSEPASTDHPDTASQTSKEATSRKAYSLYSGSLTSTLIKITLLGLLNAVAVYGAIVAALGRDWIVLGVIVVATVVLDLIYLPANKLLPGKYLAPGVVFLLLFQVFVVGYSIYIGFTNYGDGHILDKQSAIESIQRNNQVQVPDSPIYPAGVAVKGSTDRPLYLIIQDPGTKKFYAGSNDDPLVEITGVEQNSVGGITGAPGFRVLSLGELNARSAEVRELNVPFSDDPKDGSLHTDFGTFAVRYTSSMKYDEAADTFTSVDGKVFRDTGEGAFVADDGSRIEPGWMIQVGFKNFQRAFGDETIRGPLIQVVLWTFGFAFLSVLTTFALGLLLAMLFNDKRVKGQKLYRTIMILPYAFPSFLSALIWSGLLNQDFGWVNQVLLGGSNIPWLTDPFWAKVSILMVNLWLGFPYMFLVSTGALQSMPEEALEAAKVDGASAWQTFWYIKLPLLMVPLAPLLVSSFAFNFNNFNLIFMLTRGGPRFPDAAIDAGASDILITLVYKVAFGQGTGRDFGLASAFAIIIFIIVGVISYFGFRQTKALENLN